MRPLPSEKDIEAAREYLRRRLDAEQSMSANLETVMRIAAQRIVEVCYAFAVNPQRFRFSDLPMRAQWDIDAVVEWLKGEIEDMFVTLAVADHEENRDKVLPLVLGERHGRTFGERLDGYAGGFRDEIELLAGAALFLGLTKSAAMKSITENMRHPWRNPDLVDGIDAPVSYGRGRTNSMFTAIENLTRFGIAEAWMRNWMEDAKMRGAGLWYVMRGSSYPCALCDSMVGMHRDEGELPPYHSHCCCIAVPVYDAK